MLECSARLSFRLLLTAAVFGIGVYAHAQYSPPPSSAAVVKGISFSTGTKVGDQFRARFTECDSHDTCDGKPLKFGCSRDPNRNTVLLKLGGNAIFFDGKMGVDADGSPLSRKTPGATDQPETSFRYPSPGRPSVDSDKVPFIVIPGGGFEKALGVQPGDIAAVVHNGLVVYALVADQGPVCKLGEGSIELHERLNHKVCLARNAANECTKLRDVGLERDVLYFIFPRSRARIIQGLNPANVNQRLSVEGPKLFEVLRTTP
jgi:hypothetical protein